MTRLDTRELVEELDELEAIERSLSDEEASEDASMSEEDIERMKALREFIEEIDGYSGDSARDGITLIPEDEFEDYARELAEEIGAIPDDAGWPMTCIDWAQAANELRMDYTSVTFDGTDYLHR